MMGNSEDFRTGVRLHKNHLVRSGCRKTLKVKPGWMRAKAAAQGWNRVLVSLFSWPGQLLVLVSLPEAKILARMLFLRILSFTVVIIDITAYLIKDCD